MARARSLTRRHQYWPAWAAGLWLAVGLISLLAIGGCRRGVPVIDPSGGLSSAEGTISGTVRGPESAAAIEGRIVEIVNLETNERQRASTNSAGGFTFKVKPGRYRVELTLRDGESLVKQPGIMNVNKSDVDAHADFVIGSTRVSRPRGPAMRTDHG
ncbi:MAG: carboxypeptidase-like regulatory domain-containing protein, partial [Burkholderiales bacterium]